MIQGQANGGIQPYDQARAELPLTADLDASTGHSRTSKRKAHC